MNSPTVSILIPSYNSESYIEETLGALLNQSYKNWECIIIDDHSTDQSFELIKNFISQKGQNHPFKLFKNNGKGACAARNFAFECSSGDYIQYLDADDQITNNKLQEQLSLLKDNPNSVANCKWGKFQDNIKNVKWSEQTINKDYNNCTEWLVDSWLGKGMAQTSTWLTPRHLIDKAGLWDETLKINQDGEFFFRVLLLAESIRFSPTCGVYYRFGSSDSVSQKNVFSEDKAESLLKSYISYETILKVRDDVLTKKAVGNNYVDFIYRYYPLYPHLLDKAEKKFYNLGFNKMWALGGEKFQKIAALIGFKNALRLRKYFS